MIDEANERTKKNQEKLLEKLKNIANQAEGEAAVGNEAAAHNINRLLQKLLIKNRMTMADLEKAGGATAEQAREPVGKRYVRWEKHGMKAKRKRVAWIEKLASIIATPHGCRILVIRGSNTIIFVGLQSSTLVCEQMLVTMVKTAEYVSYKEYCSFYNRVLREDGDASRARGYQAAWLLGFVERVRERLHDALHPFKELSEEDEPQEHSTALTLFKKDIVLADEYIANMKTGMASAIGGRGGDNYEGRRDGRAYANRVKLGQESIGSGGSNNPRLGG